MKGLISILLFISALPYLQAQQAERRLIIQDKNFYYSSIDEEFQVATLHKGNISESLGSAIKLAVPAGRNYNDPIIPFSWDLRDQQLYAVNFLLHPMNDWNEGLKRIPLKALKAWDEKTTVSDMIMLSVDHHLMAYNDPYLFTIRRSNTLQNFFFDIIALNDSSFCMVITNNGELNIWNYNGKSWKQGAVQPFTAEGFFSLFSKGGEVYLASNAGELFMVEKEQLTKLDKKLAGSLSEGIIVDNRDAGTLLYLRHSDWNTGIPLEQLLEKKAKPIF